MCQPTVHGDQILLMALSYKWAARITVLNSKLLNETTFRHDKMIEDADLVLIHNGKSIWGGHYTAAGKERQRER